MAIVIACQCGKKLRIRVELAGRKVKCPNCGAVHPPPKVADPQLSVPELERVKAAAAPPPVPVSSAPVAEPQSSPAREPARADSKDQARAAKPAAIENMPRQIGDYIIDDALGRGAHGIVYRAHPRKHPDTSVALKVVENRGNIDHLLLEPALLSQLDHPCIVGIQDYFLSGTDLVLALDYIEGRDLNTELELGRVFDQAEIRDLLLQLASALAQAHSRSIVHRDIKPSNILVVDDKGRVRFVLTDFGIGRRAEGIQVEKHGGGTYLYMAPEQLRGRPGPQSDLWSLGVVAYRLLTGRLPFPGPGLPELSQQILYGAPAPPSQVCSDPVDPELEALVLRLLDKSLQERYASAEELLAALGFRGSPEEVLARRRRSTPPKIRTSLERQLKRAIALRLCGLVAAVVLYLLAGGALSGLFLLLGMVAFYFGQARRKLIWTVNAFALIGVHAYLRYMEPNLDTYGLQFFGLLVSLQGRVLNWLGRDLGPVIQIAFAVLTVVLFLAVFLFLPVIAGWMYASVRRLQRQRVLRQAAMAGEAGSERFLEVFQKTLDSRFEDVDFHLKYAEALFNSGRITAAAVEARLLLVQDPYHFNGNLLLAHAYQNLGLYRDCLSVCEDYLAMSGYCFEFGELRAQCRRRLAIA